MFGYFKRKKAREEETAYLISEASLRARTVLHIAIDEVQHDIKYTKHADSPELVARFFESLKSAAKLGVDEVLIRKIDPFGEDIKVQGSVAVGAGMIANGVRNEIILLGAVNENDVKQKINFHIIRVFEQLMDQTLE